MFDSSPSPAESLIRKSSARVTATRVKVLDFLLSQSQSFTHQEIAQELSKTKPVDSVTLYRVLECLTENELIHRIAGEDQVWRFSAGGGQSSHEHAHFQCTRCTKMTCFTDIKLPQEISLPTGFHSREINYLIKGICPQCN